jgi:SRSO17 transposase
MDAGFSARRREIEQDAKITEGCLAGANQRLEIFLRPFGALLPRSETRENALVFVRGLLSDLHRKNTESIAYRFGRKRDALQSFIGESPWDHKPLLIELAKQTAKTIGEDDGILAFDPSGFEKDGKKSAGVARQWLGRFGKVDNGQVGTFLAYVTRKEYALVGAKLFIPQEWTDDPARCERARIPKDEYEVHKTRHEHCLEMLDEQGALLPHAWVTGDDELGRSSWFRRSLRERNEQYCLAVPSDTNVRDLDNVPEYTDSGAPPQDEFVRVDHLREQLAAVDWTEIDVCDGEKHPLKMKLAVFHVLAKTERGKHGSGDSEWLIIVGRPAGKVVKRDDYLSNAKSGTTWYEFARAILGSHRVEDGFRRAKSECGLAEYEVQSWTGWHHHVTLCLRAGF